MKHKVSIPIKSVLSIKYYISITGIKFLCVFLIITYYLLLITTSASAEEFSLGISPQIIKISSHQGQTVEAKFEIENFSDNPVTLQASFKEFTASDRSNHQIKFISNTKDFTQLIDHTSIILDSIPVNRLSLGPKQKQSLVLNIDIPATAPKRDYTFSLIFTDISNSTKPNSDDSSFSTVSGGIAMNILLSVGKNDKESIEIKDFSTPFLIQSGIVFFNIQIKNPGIHLINPQGTIRIYNTFGHLIGKIDLPRLNILAKSKRTYFETETSNQIYLNTNNDIKVDQKIIWSEKILLGLYKANLKFTLENGESVERTIHFLALPYKTLLIILVLFIAVLLIKKRVSHHLNK